MSFRVFKQKSRHSVLLEGNYESINYYERTLNNLFFI